MTHRIEIIYIIDKQKAPLIDTETLTSDIEFYH